MEKIARSIEETRELVNAMLKGGEACLDWGTIDSSNANVSCKYFADEVAREFQQKGYFVYYQLMGWGRKDVPQGTPILIRIKTKPKCSGSSLVEFS
jgi:hypothetical protein